MRNKAINTAALIGKGERLTAILDCVDKLPNAEVKLVISYKKESPGVELAKERGIEGFSMYWYGRRKAYEKEGKGIEEARRDFCGELARALEQGEIDLVIMAGWDVILTKEYFEGFSGKTMNIHPALLPAFAGLHGSKVQEEVLRSGVKETGATLHFVVDEGVDTGPIIFQEKVAVEEGDTIESLEAKIHKKEDKMLCEGIRLFIEGRLMFR